MGKPNAPIIGSIALVLVIAGVLLLALRVRESDAAACRAILTGLAQGKSFVARRIDWNHLTAMGVNVGETYTKLPDDKQRADYRQAFVTQFARGFQQSGARPKDFVRWRLERREQDRVVIAVDYPAKKKTLLMSLPSSGTKKLEDIRWQ